MTELSLEESLSMFMAEIAKRLDKNTNFNKKIRAFTEFALRNQKASIKAWKFKNLFSELKKMTLPSLNHLNDDYWDELKETDGEKDLEAHYTNAKPHGKALP
ncbi:hypothetical protein Tco_0907859 [Tanacetum coccineum]|uniref:Uncharacterized protein n=1 Tax=Tanacetum coccineum TaxID=301880 RepID=A0ABQ5CRV0_9ASTR